ncbi:probable staphylococcal-like nuclease CAN2 isoform X1 [Triticum urartu]|uniref:probable staphylococcal-like nuclease CAN2 isoform X1 n=1 Tax=Triticum urartu TaxID=4572 RepID=UPI002044107A|nr:probable staphylococcal-like nuclease CAN2 isoform X1 [Triticum urartu]
MGNILRSLQPRQQQQQEEEPLDPHGLAPAAAAIAALTCDLSSFESSSMVPEGLGQHVTSSQKAQINWYKCILEAYRNTTPPRTPAEAAQLVATALNWIPRVDLEAILEFYNFPIPTSEAAFSNQLPTALPDGVQFVLNTLPVNAKCIGDGDGFTAYVAVMDDPRESANVPQKVYEMVTERTQARIRRDYDRADTLRSTIDEAGYKIIIRSGSEILARKYRIRMRGIDAPELKMPYGKESKDALVKLIGGKSTRIYVYEQDQFGRYVGDIYCDSVFIQEQMLKNGHAWYFKNYDSRREFSEWEKKARAACQGLWALNNPEKPWDWRRDERNGRHITTEKMFAKVAWLGALLLGGRYLKKLASFLWEKIVMGGHAD